MKWLAIALGIITELLLVAAYTTSEDANASVLLALLALFTGVNAMVAGLVWLESSNER